MPIVSGSTVIRGSRGTPVAQDADDKLITVIQGSQGNAVAQDANDRLIAMMYGSAGTPIAQDAADKLIAVMQGDNGVAIAQDASNRMEAVLYGDTGVVAQDANNINTIGLGELGGRLGSPYYWDTRGRLFWMDDFESTVLKWNPFIGGAGPTVTRVTTTAFAKDASIELSVPATVDTYAGIEKLVYKPVGNIFGFEFAFSQDHKKGELIYVYLDVFTGTTRYEGSITIDPATGTVKLFKDDTTYYTFPNTIAVIEDINFWHRVKLVVDVQNSIYQRLLIDGYEYDISAYGIYSSASVTGASISAKVRARGDAAGTLKVYVDNAVISYMEPAE